jgi:hypothetical protein
MPARAAAIEIETQRIHARKTDLAVERLGLVWVPSRIDTDGSIELVGSREI